MTHSSRPKTKKTSKNRPSAANEQSGHETGQAKKASGKTSAASKGTRKNASRRKQTSISTAIKRMLYLALFLLLTAILLLDVDQADSVAMQPAIYKDDLVVSFAPPFVRQKPSAGHVYLIRSDDTARAPSFLRIIACGRQTVAYNTDIIKLNRQPLKRMKLTNDAIVRPPDSPEIWRESLENGETWRIILPQNPVYGRLVGSVPLSPDACFAAGDNRMAAYDSRHFGAIRQDRIAGRALFILHTKQEDGLLGAFIKPL